MKLGEETGAVQPNCNYLREKRHGSRFIREHNIVLDLLWDHDAASTLSI